MGCTPSGARLTAFPWSSLAHPTFNFFFPPLLDSRKKLSSYGSPVSSFVISPSDKKKTKEKGYNFGLFPHTSKICSTSAKFTFQHKAMKKCGTGTLLDYGAEDASSLRDAGDLSTGFTSAFLLIFLSELGDKTFFIAALLAARNSAAVTFIGTFGALAVMTVISVVLGRTFHYVDDILPFSFSWEMLICLLMILQQSACWYILVFHPCWMLHLEMASKQKKNRKRQNWLFAKSQGPGQAYFLLLTLS
ncbi:GDT1-like protein 1, chloroplastic [Salvia divinorum]|uniref:GDT1 family protein n=1 Tax=Salvia divinorum TaxID=28513 RepID=A0ABD1HPW8_SALDI